MYKVVIIDDEPVIVEGLTRVVDWEKYGLLLCGSAEDGKSGLEVIRREHPDMIITDISMPELNGLGMIAALKSEFPDTEVCILTGYREFEYAQEAIHLGVTRFLLKPSNMGQIEEALQVMAENLKKKKIPGQEESGENKDDHASSFIVKNAVVYMEQHYKEHLTLSEVAEQIYVSQWHLSKLLNRYEKKSFSEILSQIRIGHAKKLLMDPALRIGDIAEEVGFLDIGHFSRVFKKVTGMSANEWRNTKV